MTSRYLFNNGDVYSQIEHWGAQLRDEVSKYSADALLNASVDALVEYFVGEYRVNVIEMDVSGISVDQSEVDIDISGNPMYAVFDRSRPAMKRGTKFSFHVPFEGDPGLFELRPSSYSLSGTPARVSGGDLVLEISQLDPDPQSARQEFERQLASVQQMLASQRSQIDSYHVQLPNTARNLITARRDKLLVDRAAVASLGYPLRARNDSGTYASSSVTQRRKIAAEPKRTPGSTKPYAPEPALSDADFARVVDVVRSLTQVMERSPSAFVRSTEETLRDHILVQLNGHFEGKAVGEAFNASGKTDILVRDADRNLLICECKFWKGTQSLNEAIDQLMSYLAWRDAKALLVIFNRNTQMSTVLAATEAAIPEHSRYRRALKRTGDSEFECVLQRADDVDREVRLKVMVMDVPTQKPTRRSKEQAPR